MCLFHSESGGPSRNSKTSDSREISYQPFRGVFTSFSAASRVQTLAAPLEIGAAPNDISYAIISYAVC